MGIVICEYDFTREDKDIPGYSLHEVDYYAWIPYNHHKETPTHRLSLRKNLLTNYFELYRTYSKQVIISHPKIEMITNLTIKGEEVIFSSTSLKAAIDEGTKQWSIFHGEREVDIVCEHKGRNISINCKGEPKKEVI